MDKYDEQIAYLTKHPGRIDRHWREAIGLFKHAGSTKLDCGCLTQIRYFDGLYAYVNGERDLELTQAIKNDERLPKHSDKIMPEHFPVFAEWQRKIDSLQTLK